MLTYRQFPFRRTDSKLAGFGFRVDVFELGETERFQLTVVVDGNVEFPTVFG